MSAHHYYRQGDLAAALKFAAEELRNSPADTDKRVFYTELLCLTDAFERADAQLQALLALEPRALITVANWRQLLRAAIRRREVFFQGAVPEVVDSLSPRMRSLLEAILAWREGCPADAAAIVSQIEAARPPAPCRLDGLAVDDLRDADDLFTGIIELLASNGKYFWVDVEQVTTLRFQRPRRPLDLLWRSAEITLTNGTVGEVFIPSIYPAPTADADAQLGRKTDWLETKGIVRGVGHRMWLAGDEAIALGTIESLEFDRA